jgi:predicted RecA/RadA family phage recombinase
MKNYVQPGEVVTFTAPANLKSGDPFMVGAMFAVAAFDALSGAAVEGAVEGVFILPKPNTVVAFNQGERVFFDAATGLCKKTASGFFPIGIATVAAGASDSTVTVRLDANSTVAV